MSELESVETIKKSVSGEEGKIDFVNCGVVMGKHQVESIGEDRETALQILRVNRNQFLVALKFLADKGDLFWVFQSSSIGCWFYFLKKLGKIFNHISLYSTLVPSRSPVYALCTGFKKSEAIHWIEELEKTSEFTDYHIETWNVRTWEEAGPLIASLRTDLYRIWTAQRDGLKEIREKAAAEAADSHEEEVLLKKLSGGTGNGAKNHTSHHHVDEWRGKKEEEGWRTASMSSGRANQRSLFTKKRSEADEADSWRR
jgi:hypothetical protein